MRAVKSIRFVAVLDQDDVVIEIYPIQIAAKLNASEEEFIVAARRIARSEELSGHHSRLRFLIAPQPNLPC